MLRGCRAGSNNRPSPHSLSHHINLWSKHRRLLVHPHFRRRLLAVFRLEPLLIHRSQLPRNTLLIRFRGLQMKFRMLPLTLGRPLTVDIHTTSSTSSMGFLMMTANWHLSLSRRCLGRPVRRPLRPLLHQPHLPINPVMLGKMRHRTHGLGQVINGRHSVLI